MMSRPTTPDERTQTLEYLAKPDEWPYWPRVPLKRRHPKTGMLEVGVMFSTDIDKGPARVWLTTLYDRIVPRETPHLDYANYEEMYDLGQWRVD